MSDERTYLPIDTIVKLNSGSIYRIIGDPVGCGGGSIIYPAQKQLFQGDNIQTDGIEYVLKECFPVSLGHHFRRNTNGEIIPCSNDCADADYLRRAQLLQMEESAVSQKIYQTSSRMLPIREASQNITLTLPGKKSISVSNTVTVMDALTDKGRSLSDWIRERRRFTAVETFRILQQVLLALREVHQAGYLHLDIQDGNIFLRGTLKDKSELITLIDFGCARATINGKTNPIQDRVIFTTPGFSAPEILQHNDGNLQLGLETDLYSVGCLALYLLTGQRPDSRMLIANRTGVFLKPNQLRRIQCPGHLVDRMQQILARALEKEPERRYHCTDEMLEDVTDLAQALQPYRTDLSCVKYDAFICYKHGSTDSAAALALQKALENYRSPKSASAGRKPFSRVFVDEGELSSCSDFGQQIREALKNSGWLIVVCSADTPASPWVQLEIETFLEYHDRSRILAVLTGGDENVSFPPQLKSTDSHGSEVFAADARGDSLSNVLKKLRKDALLRLAAPMLGTTYDTLKQRQKLYRMKRLAGACAALLVATAGFAAYAVNRGNIIASQAVRIEQEYRNALINESRFLTEQAQKRLDHNDPIGAMELLLKALPSTDQDRPVLTEAEYVLGKALGIYKTPSAVNNTITAEGIVETSADCFFVNSNGDTLFLWDAKKGILQAWEARSLDMLWSQDVPYVVHDTTPVLYQDRTLALLTYGGITSIDAASGAENWSVAITDPVSLSVSEDGKTVLVISGDRGDHAEAGMENPADHVLNATYICADTGRILQSNTFSIDGSQYVCSNICVSPDLSLAAVPTMDEGYDNFVHYQYNSLYLIDLNDGQSRLILDSQTQIQAMTFLDNQLALIRTNGYTREGANERYRIPYTCWLELYSAETGNGIWSVETTDYQETGGIYQILETGYTEKDERYGGVLFVYENQCLLTDRMSGKTVRHYTLPAATIYVQLTEKGFISVNRDGSVSRTGFGIDTLVEQDRFPVGLSNVCQQDDVFYIQTDESNTVYKYRANRSDPNYTSLLAVDDRYVQIEGIYNTEEMLRVFLVGENRFCLTDIHTGEFWECAVPDNYSKGTFVGFSKDGNRIYWSKSGYWDDPVRWIGNSIFYCTDMQTGVTEELRQPECPWAYASANSAIYLDGCFYFLVERIQDNDIVLCQWDPTLSTLEIICELTLRNEQDQWESYVYGSFQQGEDGKFTFGIANSLSNAPQKWVQIDPETRTIDEIVLHFVPEAGTETYVNLTPDCCLWDEDCNVTFAYGKNIYAADLQGDLIFRMEAQDDIISLKAVQDGDSFLLVLSSGRIIKYSAITGEEQSSLQLSEYCNGFNGFYDDLSWQIVAADNLLLITKYGGIVLDVSDDTLAVRAVVDQCIAYDPIADRFLVEGTDGTSGELTSVGSFHRYQIIELIQMATEIINN